MKVCKLKKNIARSLVSQWKKVRAIFTSKVYHLHQLLAHSNDDLEFLHSFLIHVDHILISTIYHVEP